MIHTSCATLCKLSNITVTQFPQPYSLNCMICHCINISFPLITIDKYFSCLKFCLVLFCLDITNNAAINNLRNCNLVQFYSYFKKLDLLSHIKLNVTKKSMGLLITQTLTVIVNHFCQILPKESQKTP